MGRARARGWKGGEAGLAGRLDTRGAKVWCAEGEGSAQNRRGEGGAAYLGETLGRRASINEE